MKVPCKNCITLPICINTSYSAVIKKCSIIDSYVEERSRRRRPGGIRLVPVSVLEEVEKMLRKGNYAP